MKATIHLVSAETYYRSDAQTGRVIRVKTPSGIDSSELVGNAGYDFRCSCCYLGYPHSRPAHALSIIDWER